MFRLMSLPFCIWISKRPFSSSHWVITPRLPFITWLTTK